MKKSKFLVVALLVCSLVSISFADSMFFDAMSGAGYSPANWTEPLAWMDWNGSGLTFNRVPTATDNVFMMDGYYWGSDPTVDTAIVNSSATVKGLYIGYWGCAATLQINDGADLAVTGQANIGYTGNAVVNQNGGTFTAGSIRMGYDTSVTTYNMNAGQLTSQPFGGFVVGAGSAGMADGSSTTFNQTGGIVTTTGFAVGKAGTTGIYNMTGGTLNGFVYGGGDFQIGAIGNRLYGSIQSEFNLGDAVSTGTIQMDSSSSLYIDRRNSMLRGWGTFDLGGASSSIASRLFNDGVVKADGYGMDRDLDLSQFNHVEIYDDENTNTGTNGWYAVNHGRLLLPSIAVVAGNGSYNWGEDAYFDETYMVNSLRINFTDVAAGNFVAALLAEDRSDVAAHDGLAFLAVWQMDQLAFANANIAFRFDDTMAASLGIDESLLNVYKLVNGAWVALPGTVNSLSNTIAISTDFLGTFAVGGVIPEPTTLIILGIGAALLRKRNH
jgi:hypothetical protein